MSFVVIQLTWRARIGALLVAPDTTPEIEFIKMVPKGVSVHFTRMRFEGAVNVETLSRLANEAESAARLLAELKPDVIAFCCTSGSFVKGVGYDKEIIDKIERATGTRATTTTTAVVNALKTLKVEKLSIATPYIDEVNVACKKFFEGLGFEVLDIKGLGIRDDLEIGKQSSETIYRLAKSVDKQDADCIFISCTNLNTIDIIQPLEYDLCKPVITSNQATMWECLKMAGVKEPLENLGALFKCF